MSLIGIDVGTSFIKAAVLDLDGLHLQHIHRVLFPAPISGLPLLFHEYDPAAVLNAVRSLLGEMLPLANPCKGIVMCGQMHGVVLTSGQGEPLSNLITWQDQRVLLPHPSSRGRYFDVLEQSISRDERRQLGNELRPGLPVGTLFWLAEQGRLPPGYVFPASLPDFIVADLCQSTPVTEITHAMSHGLLNLESLQWHADVISRLGLGGLQWPALQPHGAVSGWLGVGDRSIPCYMPVGDYQCALLGAMVRAGELSINISTGSQVSLLRPGAVFGDFQTRPFFDGQFLSCITHIPAGRSLNRLVKLLCELAEAQQVELADPWDYITRAAAGVQQPEMQVDLAFFNSSFGDHGEISHIREEELTVGHLFRAAFENMAENYYASALRISPAREWRRLVFSGGLALKIPLLRELICARFQADYRLCPTSEDTLLGLLALGLVFSERLPSTEHALRLLEQSYREE
jgi:sugar (pentulose or hexulose) kinase